MNSRQVRGGGIQDKSVRYRSNCAGSRKSIARRSYVFNLLKPEN